MPPETNEAEAAAADKNEAAATPPAATAPVAIVNEKGEFAEKWYEKLSEDLRESPSLKNIKTLEGMAKSYLSAQRMVGADKVPLLTENSTDEEKAEFYKKLGRPETPEGYKFKPVDEKNLPKGLQQNVEFEKAFAKKAFELGMTVEQANQLRDWHNGIVMGSFKDADTLMDEEYEAAMAQLKKDWGNATQANIDLANKVIVKFDPEHKLAESGLGNNPNLVRIFAQIGKMISEDALIIGEASKTPANAQSQINEIVGNPKHPYFIKDHPQHNEAVAKVAALYAQKNPEMT